jgi:transcriptional regulator with XRE-family HTH domain
LHHTGVTGVKHMSQQPRTWQELLAMIILDPDEKRRIATELGITEITLDRWVKGEHAPSSLKKLNRLHASIPPNLRDQFGELIAAEYVEFTPVEKDAIARKIPGDFWPLLLSTRRDSPNVFWQVCFLALQQALVHLDPARLGTEIIVVSCMPPRAGKVRSLRETVGMGTRPWRGDLQHKRLFLGAESLAGYSITTGHQAVVQDIEHESNLLPIHHVTYEKAAAAFPIVVEGAVAGCMLISCTQLNFFLPERLALLAQYADVLSLAFRSEAFYPPSSIELRIMPPDEVQDAAFASFADRRDSLLMRAQAEERPLNAVQAEQIVLGEMEEEFLQWHASPLSSERVAALEL